jgi:hypothetical protein
MPELSDYLEFKQQKLGELREKLADPGLDQSRLRRHAR